MGAPAPLLLEDVRGYLADSGVEIEPSASIRTLENGVSARVYLVESAGQRLVVKQALPELRVAGVWAADPRRGVTEAAALRVAEAIDPGAVPHVLGVDAARCIVTMSAAPDEWANWRDLLFEEPLDAPAAMSVADRIGTLLGRIHRATWGEARVQAQFADYDAFEELRITPFHRTVRKAHPRATAVIDRLIDELLTTRQALVHGDASPKNVLAGRGDAASWLLDFEVAHYGAPIFDLAFMLHHLALKAIARPAHRSEYERIASSFLAAHTRALSVVPRPSAASPMLDTATLGWHCAVLVLARVDGVSPVGYLTEEQRGIARAVALTTLSSRSGSAVVFWNIVAAAAAAERIA